jgi:hypothetical protein
MSTEPNDQPQSSDTTSEKIPADTATPPAETPDEQPLKPDLPPALRSFPDYPE